MSRNMLQISLKAARVNSGLNAKDVAKMVDVHPQTLWKYEKDSSNIPYSLVEKLSDIYHIPIDNIFLGKEYDLIRIKKKEKI